MTRQVVQRFLTVLLCLYSSVASSNWGPEAIAYSSCEAARTDPEKVAANDTLVCHRHIDSETKGWWWLEGDHGNLGSWNFDPQQPLPEPVEPQECQELGQYYDSSSQQCVTECAHGSLDYYCNQEPLPPDPEEPQCGPDHPDYQGTIGYGGEATLVCGDPNNQCPTGSTYGVIGKDGVAIGGCISNEYNPPKCSGTDVLKVDQWGGHSCLPLNKPGESNEPGGQDDPNNGDSDGDGQGDLTGIAKQLQDVKSLLGRGNTNTDNITESLKGMGKRLEDAIGNIPGGGGGGSGGDGEGEGDGEPEEPITWSGEPIDTELTDPSDDYDQVMADYQAKINEIKGEVQAMFSTNLSGGGSVDDNTHSIMGVDVNFSLNRFLSGLDILGAIVLFCAAFISAGILFSGRG